MEESDLIEDNWEKWVNQFQKKLHSPVNTYLATYLDIDIVNGKREKYFISFFNDVKEKQEKCLSLRSKLDDLKSKIGEFSVRVNTETERVGLLDVFLEFPEETYKKLEILVKLS